MQPTGIHDIREYADEIIEQVEEIQDECETTVVFSILKFIKKNSEGEYEVSDRSLMYLPNPRHVIDFRSIIATMIEIHRSSTNISKIEFKNAYSKLIDELYEESSENSEEVIN